MKIKTQIVRYGIDKLKELERKQFVGMKILNGEKYWTNQ